MSRTDAIVIGANVAGLAAAAYLARAGKQVALLEAQAAPLEPFGPQDALDPQMLSDLNLIGHGLRFSQRDLALTLLRAGEAPLTLVRDHHAATRAIAAVSDADAKAFAPFRRDLLARARRLRGFWWRGLAEGTPHDVLKGRTQKEEFDRLCLTGADAYLSARFEHEGLIAALLWDAVAGGFAPNAPGSALALVWRAAGEMAGLQGASALPEPGTLMRALQAAASGAQLRAYARAAHILTSHGAVEGVALEDGEVIAAPLVLSAISSDATHRLLDVPMASAPDSAQARLLLTLHEPLRLPPARYRIAERAETYLGAQDDARAGRIPSDPPLEFVVLESGRLAATLAPFPVRPPEGWRAQAAARAIIAISRHVPGLAGNIANVEFQFSAQRASLNQLLAPAGARVRTGMAGLYLCGPDAEPVSCVSGRAARIASEMALRQDQK